MTTRTKPVQHALTGFRQEYSQEGGHLYYVGDAGPLPGATTITGLQEAIGGSDGLMNWAVNITVSKALEVFANTGDEIEARSEAWKAKNAARDLGSAVHKVVDRMNKDTLGVQDPITARHAAQYGAFAIKHRLNVLASEQMVANLTLGFGGSLDLLGELDGELTLIDVKTGKERQSHRLQLTGYTMAEVCGYEGEEPQPMPDVKRACVLYLTEDSFTADAWTVTQRDRDHFARLVKTYHQLNEWRKETA